MTKYDLYNPTSARRIIHTGTEESRAVEILPRVSVDAVELADHVAKSLINRATKNPEGELRIRMSEDAPDGAGIKMTIDESKVSIVKAKAKS